MIDIIMGICFLFVVPSCLQFWVWFINLEKTNQIDLKGGFYEKK